MRSEGVEICELFGHSCQVSRSIGIRVSLLRPLFTEKSPSTIRAFNLESEFDSIFFQDAGVRLMTGPVYGGTMSRVCDAFDGQNWKAPCTIQRDTDILFLATYSAIPKA